MIARWKPFLEKARSSGQGVNTGEYRVTCRDGSVLICELHAAFLAEDLIVTFNNVTERKRAEDALQESERKFRETVVTLDEGYYSVTLDGKLLEHNQAFNRILGFDISKDLKGIQLPDFWQDPDQTEGVSSGVRRQRLHHQLPDQRQNTTRETRSPFWPAPTWSRTKTAGRSASKGFSWTSAERMRAEAGDPPAERGARATGVAAHRPAGSRQQGTGGLLLFGFARPAGAAAGHRRLLAHRARRVLPQAGR